MKAIALVLCILLAGAAAVQVQSEADETIEAQLVDADEMDVADNEAVTVEGEDEAEADEEAEDESVSEEDSEAEAEEDSEAESETESEAEKADAEWWFWKKAAKKAKSCADCTNNGHLYMNHWPTGGMMCVDKSNAEHYRWAMSTKFPKAEKEAECAGAKKSAESIKSGFELNKIKATTDKLEANTNKAKDFAKGTTDYKNCPLPLWRLFVQQTAFEKEYIGPTYAGGHQSAAAGIAPDIPEYDIKPFGALGDVYGQYEDIKDTIELIKGGFQPSDLSAFGAGIVVKMIQAGMLALAKKALEATLIDNNVRGTMFDPAVDVADCIVDPKITKELSIMNWPTGDAAEITIVCPVCNHITIPMAKLALTHKTEHDAIVAAAAQISAIGKAVRKDASKFTNQNPFGKSKAGTAIVTFLKAIEWMEGDKKAKLDTAALKTDTDAGAGSVAFLSIHERVRKAARHVLMP